MRITLLKQTLTAIATAMRRREQIKYRAFHDELTGLPNRYLFNDRLEQALARAYRCPHSFAVALIDVDRFKFVNDAFGHWVGDELLKHIGSRLTATLRAGDTAARLGGDEFVLLLVDASDVPVIAGAIDRINDALRRPVRIDGHDLVTSCSIGFSVFPRDGADAPSLLRQADLAMYAQKTAGRTNTWTPARPERPRTECAAAAADAVTRAAYPVSQDTATPVAGAADDSSRCATARRR